MDELDGIGGGVARGRAALTWRVATLALALICSLAAPAAAQSPAPVVDAPLLHAPLLLRSDAQALRTNPAQLVWVNGARAHFAWTQAIDGDLARDRSFDGAVAGSWNGRLGAAIGGTGSLDAPRATAARFGLAIGADTVALGWSVAGWHGPRLAGRARRSHDIGLSWRATPHVGLALVGEALNRPRIGAARLPRRWSTAVAVRSAREHVGLELGVRSGRVAEAFGTVHLRPIDGVRLMSTVRSDLIGRAPARTWTVGVELAAGGSQLAGGVGSVDIGTASALVGTGVLGWAVSGSADLLDRRQVLWRVDLAGGWSERPEPALLGDDSAAFTDLLAVLERASHEPTVGGVYLNVGGVTLGGAQLWELRTALDTLQQRGKVVIAYLSAASYRDLYLVGGADLVVAARDLAVLRTGIGGTAYYLADLFALLGVEAQFVRIGDYKSGPERFTESGPTEPAREQLDAFMDAAWSQIAMRIRTDSGLDHDAFDALWSQPPLMADDLADTELVDAVGTTERLREELVRAAGGMPTIVPAPREAYNAEERWMPPNPIAVLHIDGSITSGRSGSPLLLSGYQTGSASVAAAVAEILADRRVRGVIIRIDSPGGSATASEAMHRELSRLAEALPVVVSMGDVAGSGGYYVAALDGAPIVASPLTLTGSIGIYAGTFALDGLLDRLGINGVRTTRGGTTDLFDGHRWSDDEVGIVTRYIENAYALFLERVASARGRTTEEIDAVARGRIHDGAAAIEAGLVDELGGFAEALALLRAEAGLTADAPISLAHYPRARWTIAEALPTVNVPIQIITGARTQALMSLLDRLGLGGLVSYVAAVLEGADAEAMALMDVAVRFD